MGPRSREGHPKKFKVPENQSQLVLRPEIQDRPKIVKVWGCPVKLYTSGGFVPCDEDSGFHHPWCRRRPSHTCPRDGPVGAAL